MSNQEENADSKNQSKTMNNHRLQQTTRYPNEAHQATRKRRSEKLKASVIIIF